jgi:hypothetical protein
MFFDMTEAWLSASHFSLSDVKEMVPQLFCVPECLVNVSHLPFSTTTDGRSVSDVKLGVWCNSPLEFTTKMRWIIESARISLSLHNWIDLIFGDKSRGEAAIEAKNLFHRLCYAVGGGESLEPDDPMEREASVSRIINYGQCPQQLFKTPHGVRTGAKRLHLMSDPRFVVQQRLDERQFVWPLGDVGTIGKIIYTTDASELLFPPNFVSCLVYAADNQTFFRVPQNSTQTLASRMPKATPILDWSASCSGFKVSSDGALVGVRQREDWLSLYWIEYERGEVGRLAFFRKFKMPPHVVDFEVSLPHYLVAFATDSTVCRHDIGVDVALEPVSVCEDVKYIAIDNRGAFVIVASYLDVVVLTINGDDVLRKSIGLISALAVPDLEEGVDNRFFATGHSSGIVMFWALDLSAGDLICLSQVDFGRFGIERMVFDDAVVRAIVTTKNEIFEVGFCGSPAVDLKKQYALRCCICLGRVDSKSCRACASCHRFFCRNCAAEDATTVGTQQLTQLCKHCPAQRAACL